MCGLSVFNDPPPPSRAWCRDPVRCRPSLPRKCMEVGHLRRVLWRHGEPKNDADRLRTARRRPSRRRPPSLRRTYVRPCRRGDALALEIGDVLCERRGAEPLPWCRTIRVMMTTRRPGERDDRDRAARRPRPNVERPLVPPLRPRSCRVTGLLCGAHHFADEALGRLAPWLRDGCGRGEH